MISICIWPDGSWCELDDLEEYPWKSDDYQVTDVPGDWYYDQIEEHVHDYLGC